MQSFVVGTTSLAVALLVLLPGGFDATADTGVGARALRNIGAFGLPALLAILGYRFGDRFMRASVWFVGIITVPVFLLTNFEEAEPRRCSSHCLLLRRLACAASPGLLTMNG
jgi:hypothetical protein